MSSNHRPHERVLNKRRKSKDYLCGLLFLKRGSDACDAERERTAGRNAEQGVFKEVAAQSTTGNRP